MTKLVALLALLCGLAYVSAQSKPCGPYMFKDCCSIPKLIAKEVFRGCMGLPPGGFKGPFSHKKVDSTDKFKTGKDGPKPFAGFGGMGGPMCIMDCVMKNQSMLTSSGDVDVAAVTDKLAGPANDTWKQLITDAVSSCATDLAKVDMTTTPAPPSWMKQVCKPTAGFFMTCLRRYLTVNCPDSAKSPDANNSCAKNIEELKGCDPFTIPKTPPMNFMEGIRKLAQRQKKSGKSEGADPAKKNGKKTAKKEKPSTEPTTTAAE